VTRKPFQYFVGIFYKKYSHKIWMLLLKYGGVIEVCNKQVPLPIIVEHASYPILAVINGVKRKV
jgi:hypothetical protein